LCILLVSWFYSLCCVPAFGKEVPLETAKVISQNIDSYNAGTAAMPIGTMVVGVPITRRSNIVVVETAHHRLTWSEVVTGRGPVILPVNETIQFFQDGNWFIVLDSNRKKHKFSLIHMEALQ
jgi:hypothetical protein